MLVKVRPAPAFPSASLPQQTFEWSLKPVMAWMRCIGVDMAHASPHVTTWPAGWKGRLMITLGWLCLAHELLGHTWNSHALWTFLHRLNPPYNVTTEKKLQPALTEMSCYIIDTANLAIHCWGVHLTAAFIARPRWPGLMEAFQRLDGLFGVEFHRRLRRSSWLAIGLVILVVGQTFTVPFSRDRTLTVFILWSGVVHRRSGTDSNGRSRPDELGTAYDELDAHSYVNVQTELHDVVRGGGQEFVGRLPAHLNRKR